MVLHILLGKLTLHLVLYVTFFHTVVLVFGFAEEKIDIFEGDEGEFCVEYHNFTTIVERTIPDIQLTMADGTAIGMVITCSQFHTQWPNL